MGLMESFARNAYARRTPKAPNVYGRELTTSIMYTASPLYVRHIVGAPGRPWFRLDSNSPGGILWIPLPLSYIEVGAGT